MRRREFVAAFCSCVTLSVLCGSSGLLASDALERGEARYSAGAFGEAERHYRLHLRDDPTSDVARFRAAQSAMQLGNYELAGIDFARVAEAESALAERASFLAGLASYRLRDYATAASEWGEAIRWVEDDGIVAAAQYGRVWCAIHRHEWSSARSELTRMRQLFPGREETERERALTEALRGSDALPLRSPSAAKWLSTALPGAGQIYAGRVGNGAVSAGLNGAFLYLLGSSVVDGRWVDALFIYLGGSRFYWGGRQNAEKFARERNTESRARFVARLARYDF